MVDYDVIIVGGGPAGSVAARKLSEEKLNVLLLEEDKSIGLPQHCSGWISGGEYCEELIKTIPKRLVKFKVKGWRIWSPKGKKISEIEDFGFGGYFVDRVNFDRELAKQAVRAGAKIKVASKATNLIIEDNKIKGIEYKSKGQIHKLTANIIIGADGVRSYQTGVARKSGLADLEKKPREFYPGIQIEFANISDIDQGIIEIFFGYDFDKHFGMCFLSPLEEDHAYLGFGNYDDYLKIKTNHPILSERLKNASEIRYLGGQYCSKLGISLRYAVKNNVALIGDAAGYHGIIPACISGEYLSKITNETIQKEEITHLKEYDKIRRKSTLKNAQFGIDLRNLNDEKLESFLEVAGREGMMTMLQFISKLKK